MEKQKDITRKRRNLVTRFRNRNEWVKIHYREFADKEGSEDQDEKS